jgi:hypothetical protein
VLLPAEALARRWDVHYSSLNQIVWLQAMRSELVHTTMYFAPHNSLCGL